MKTKADVAYSDIKTRIEYGTCVFANTAAENFKILDSEINTVNLAKCGLDDLESEQNGSTAYLAYLLQSKKKVEFGVCPKAKMWFNHAGLQTRCLHEGAQIPVRCKGALNHCTILANKPK